MTALPTILSAIPSVEIATVPDAFGYMTRLGCYKYWTADKGDWMAPRTDGKQNHILNPVNILYHEGMKALILMPNNTAVDMVDSDYASRLWHGSTAYAVGDIVQPVTPNGHTYRCIRAGTSGATTPVFPTTAAGEVDDPDAGGARWREVGVSWLECRPVGEDADWLRAAFCGPLNSLYAVSSASLVENPAIYLQTQRALRAPIATTWATGTAYALGAVVSPATSPGARYYRCSVAGTSGGSEPAWPTAAGGTAADNDVTWTEFHETWFFEFGAHADTGVGHRYVMWWNRLGQVGVGQATAGTDATALGWAGFTAPTDGEVFTIPEGTAAEFAVAPVINWTIYCVHGRIIVSCSLFDGSISWKLPNAATSVPSSACRVGVQGGGAFAFNVTPYTFAASGSFQTESLEHLRTFTNDADVETSQTSFPVPDVGLNGAVVTAVKSGSTSGSKRAYTVTLTAADAYHTPVIQAVGVRYDPTVLANGATPSGWTRALDNTYTDVTDWVSELRIELPDDLTSATANITFSLSGQESEWQTELLALWANTDKAKDWETPTMAVRVGCGYNYTDSTSRVVTHITGQVMFMEEPWAVRDGHRLSFTLRDQWLRYNQQAINFPPIFGETWADGISLWAQWCGKRTAEIVIDATITDEIPDPGWGYDDPPGLLKPADNVGEAMRTVIKEHGGRCEHDGMGVLRCAPVRADLGAWADATPVNWHDEMDGSGLAGTWVALNSGTTGATEPVWADVDDAGIVADNDILWYKLGTIERTVIVFGGVGDTNNVASQADSTDVSDAVTGLVVVGYTPDGAQLSVVYNGGLSSEFPNPRWQYETAPGTYATATELTTYAENIWKDRARGKYECVVSHPDNCYWMLRPGFPVTVSRKTTVGGDPNRDCKAAEVTIEVLPKATIQTTMVVRDPEGV